MVKLVAMTVLIERCLLPALLVGYASSWTVSPRASAPAMNAAEEARIRSSLGGSDGRSMAPPPVTLGADAQAAARTASFEEAQALGSQLAALLSEGCRARPPEMK